MKACSSLTVSQTTALPSCWPFFILPLGFLQQGLRAVPCFLGEHGFLAVHHAAFGGVDTAGQLPQDAVLLVVLFGCFEGFPDRSGHLLDVAHPEQLFHSRSQTAESQPAVDTTKKGLWYVHLHFPTNSFLAGLTTLLRDCWLESFSDF
jgi:hypothetical protein